MSTTIISQPNVCYGQDAQVVVLDSDSSSGDANYGTVIEMCAVSWTIGGSPVFIRSFLRFTDLDPIPEGATVTLAMLNLFGPTSSISAPQGNYGSNACYVQRVTDSWDESTITWNNQPASTTTNQATIPASTSTWSYNPSIDVTDIVQDMVNLPASERYGFCILLQTEETYRSVIFATSNASSDSLHPEITVTYTIDCEEDSSRSAAVKQSF